MPRVSILMAHSGPPTYIASACRAIDAQLYSDFELIVVDDGAGLDWDLLLGALRHPWRVLTNPATLGLARSLNLAANAATGSLLARMDSDDVIVPWRLEKQVAHLDAHPEISFLGSAVYWLDEQGRYLARSYPLTDSDDLRVGLSLYNQMSHGSMLIRREAFERVGGYDDSLTVAQDYDLWLRAVQTGHTLANLPEPLYGQRLHGASTTSRGPRAQSDVAERLWKLESRSARSIRVAEWFDAGRNRPLGRPYESLQLGRLGVLLFAGLASGRLGEPCRRSVACFAARHAGDALKLLLREVGWRRQTVTKTRSMLSRA